jgi:hypothetical protein
MAKLFEVEKVVKTRVLAGQREFEVKWKVQSKFAQFIAFTFLSNPAFCPFWKLCPRNFISRGLCFGTWSNVLLVHHRAILLEKTRGRRRRK